jgi:hypothetical protein
MKTIAIMQPYFLPYIGYFQLIAAVDIFILYDNIKYTKKGWINRNRMLRNEKDVMFSVSLKKNSDLLNICEREISVDFSDSKLLNQFKNAYQKAPYFNQTFPLIEQIVRYRDENLFTYLHNSIRKICEHLGIDTPIRVSSTIAVDDSLKNENKVLALCEAVGGGGYINALGGMELYSQEAFKKKEIELKFIKSLPFEYKQFGNTFIPWLSIIDVMMFNSQLKIEEQIFEGYSLISN